MHNNGICTDRFKKLCNMYTYPLDGPICLHLLSFTSVSLKAMDNSNKSYYKNMHQHDELGNGLLQHNMQHLFLKYLSTRERVEL